MSKLKEFRKDRGMTQENMAQTLGITLSMYEKVEGGRAGASAAFMRRLKAAFPDASIDAIFFDCNSNDVAVGKTPSALANSECYSA